MRRTWTPEKIEYLTNNYSKTSVKECANHLNTTVGSIHTQAKRLKLINKRNIKLAPEVIEKILLLYKEGVTIDKISQAVNLSKWKVNDMIVKYATRNRTTNWTQKEIDFLIENYRAKGISYCCEKLNKERGPLKKKANKLGLYLFDTKEWTDEEENFIINNYIKHGSQYCCEKLNITKNELRHKLRYLDCRRKDNKGKFNFLWKGYGEITGSHICRIKAGAVDRNIIFDVTIEQIWDLFLKQNCKCAISGVELKFESQAHVYDATASLDRIDSSKGYIINNVQWVHKDLNKMKLAMSDEKFINWCHMISDYQRNKS